MAGRTEQMLDPSQLSYSSQVPLDHKEHSSCFQESGNNPNLAPAIFTEVWELSVKQFSVSSGLPQDNRVLFCFSLRCSGML